MLLSRSFRSRQLFTRISSLHPARMTPSPSQSFSKLTIGDDEDNVTRGYHSKVRSKGKNKPKGGGGNRNAKPSQSTNLRGRDNDSREKRISKTLSWLLRHKAEMEGLDIRSDGYVEVSQMLNHHALRGTGLDLEGLRNLVQNNDKQRFDLRFENTESEIQDTVSGSSSSEYVSNDPVAEPRQTTQKGIWWIRARQGHTMKNVQLVLEPILSVKDIPTGIAIHGTNRAAWKIIAKEGLSKMDRNHIHIAQDVSGGNVISGMRVHSQILIYVDVDKAISCGIKFWMSDNGVILTEGDENGYLLRNFFIKVVDVQHGDLSGWEEK